MEPADTPIIDDGHVDLSVRTVERRERKLAEVAQPGKGNANVPLAVLDTDSHIAD